MGLEILISAQFGREAKREHLFCFLAYCFRPSAFLELARSLTFGSVCVCWTRF